MAMSTETGSLILKCDATQTDAGAKSLDKLTDSADKADKSVKQLNETTDEQAARLKAMVAASMEKVRA
jgi:hypothetical protein